MISDSNQDADDDDNDNDNDDKSGKSGKSAWTSTRKVMMSVVGSLTLIF